MCDIKASTTDDSPYPSREEVLDLSDITPLAQQGGFDDTDEVDGPTIEIQGYVYVIMETKDGSGYATGYYRVGSTTEPNKRLAELQAGNVRPLKYTRCEVVSDMEKAESAAQSALDHFSRNLGGGTDWFFANSATVDTFYFTFTQEVSRFRGK